MILRPIFALALFAAGAHAQTLPWDKMDLGPFQSGCFKVRALGDQRQPADQVTAKGIAVKVGSKEQPMTILFDPELLRISAGWTGGFVTFPRGRGGLEGTIGAQGEIQFVTAYAPGWGSGTIESDPRDRHQGNLPPKQAKWRGLHLAGDKVVFDYSIGALPVLELPGSDHRGVLVFTRTFNVGKMKEPAIILLADVPGSTPLVEGSNATLASVHPSRGPIVLKAAVTGSPAGSTLHVEENGRLVLKLAALSQGGTFEVALWSGPAAQAPAAIGARGPMPDLRALTKGGPARWGAPLETTGKLGSGDGPYVVDEIPLPDSNPFNSWLRPGGHDFFPDGTAALVNLSGDVWLVSGLDEELAQVRWKRFATGLFQPLGCKVVNGQVHVLGRDQITRLHDLNHDGEADWYENFNNDCVATDNYHEFALDLQTDSSGNFYYAKGSPWTPTNTTPHQGTLLRVSKDGAKMEVFATGLRAPNGLGVGPNDLLTCSDNQGHWVPANRLNVIRQGGFYGMVPAAQKKLRFRAADGSEFEAHPGNPEDRKTFKTEFWGKADTPKPVEGYDPPLVWMPQQVDNSPGGEVWVTGGKWGPWEGRMLHLSYGHCLLYGVLMETIDGVMQGGVVRFPFKFSSGIMRGRFHPKDGQLYVSGLNVWQSDAARFGCFSRVRYTGKPVTMPIEMRATTKGIELKFSGPLEETSATDRQNFSVERWNYQWTGEYGSKDYSAAVPQRTGKDLVLIDALHLSPDKTTLMIELPEMAPVMQMKIKYKLTAADGRPVDHEIYNTINKLPAAQTALSPSGARKSVSQPHQ